MGGFWEVCFLRKAQEPHHPKPGFPGFRASALHSSATLPNGSAALPILCRKARRERPRAQVNKRVFVRQHENSQGWRYAIPVPLPDGARSVSRFLHFSVCILIFC